MARTNKNARKMIIKFLQKNGYYGVSWSTHFCGERFVLLKLNKERRQDMTNEIYGAIFESYWDLVGDDKVIDQWDRCKDWNDVVDKLKEKYNDLF